MPFRYPCFVSYRQGRREYTRRMIDSFYASLSQQIDWLLPGADVYIDYKRLEVADFFNQELATAICESACMVLLYNPSYFDLNATYCAREYKAMAMLEQQRLCKLPQEQRKSLIITAVIRGEETMPEEIKTNRLYHSFEKDLLRPDDFERRNACLEPIRRIAKYIAQRCDTFQYAGVDPCADCRSFQIPSELEIASWLSGMTRPLLPLPGRRTS